MAKGKLRKSRSRRRSPKQRRLLRLEGLEQRRVLAAFVVTTPLDIDDDTDGLLSLREAISEANDEIGADSISFDETVFAQPTTIALTQGQLNVTDSVTIMATGADRLTIDASSNSRVINFFAAEGDLTLSDMTITNGNATTDEGGGGIRFASSGTLTLSRTVVINSQASGKGGGIYVEPGDLVVNESVIANNLTTDMDASGGGIAVNGGVATVADSRISGNSTLESAAKGGGIYSASGLVSVSRTEVIGNQTQGMDADGGAIYSAAGVSISESELTENMTLGGDADGGAIFANLSLQVVDSDVSGNSTQGDDSGGGAIAVDASSVLINSSSLTGNSTTGQSANGGGLFVVRGSATIVNSTLSANAVSGSESLGGGISAFFTSVSVSSSTVTGNSSASEGGGIAFLDSEALESLAIRGSIVAENMDSGTAPDFQSPTDESLLTVESSLIGDNTGTQLSESQTQDSQGNIVGAATGNGVIDPLLGDLMKSGITRVHPLLEGSLAIDSSDNSSVGGIDNDQRGQPFIRIANNTVDMGAFESQSFDSASFIVTTDVDELDFSNADVSLREAMTVANGTTGSNTITFDTNAFAQPTSIDLILGGLSVTETLIIEGPGRELLSLNAMGESRLLDVGTGSVDITISGMDLRGGKATEPDSGGGAIRFLSDGTLTLSDSSVRDNQAVGLNSNGGGIYSQNGFVVLNRTNITENSTHALGGGVYSGGGVIIGETTFANNRASNSNSQGGGLFASRLLGNAAAITTSTFTGNETGGQGGGIAIGSGGTQISNTTISQNTSSGDGGGLFVSDASGSTHRVVSSTITMNESSQLGGGISFVSSSSSLSVLNSIAAANQDAGESPELDLSRHGGQTSVQGSLVGDNTGTGLSESQTPDALGNLIGSASSVIDPLLGPLAFRGGVTASHSLQTGSPAIDAGDSLLVGELQNDQRGDGFARVSGAAVDIGSFESQTLAPTAYLVTTANDELNFANSQLSLREALELAEGSIGVDTIRFDPATFASATSIDLTLGELAVTNSVVIAGPGQDLLTIDGQNASRVVHITNPMAAVVISDLTISGGATTGNNADNNGVPESTHSGGAIRFDGSGSLTLQRVGITNNNTSGTDARGGGVFVNGASLTISASTISGNTTSGESSDGGGLFVSNSVVSIDDSSISNNATSGNFAGGGGVSALDASLNVENSQLTFNRTYGGNADGGGIESRGTNLTLASSTVSMNGTDDVNSDGGGLFFRNGNLQATATNFDTNNTIGSTSVGGGIAASSATVGLRDVSIVNNITSGDGSHGGGLALGGSDLSAINTTFSTNSTSGDSASGGGIHSEQMSSITLVNSTVAANTASGDGGGLHLESGESEVLSLANSIVATNRDSGLAPDIHTDIVGATVRSTLLGDNTGSPFLEAQTPDAMDNLIGDALGVGIIAPLLEALGNNGGITLSHALQAGSPAIDSGDNSLAVDIDDVPLGSDQRGEPFLRFSGAGDPNTVDLGAIESQPAVEPIISWPDPANIFTGTALSSLQLNASTNTAGTFAYSPEAGAVLPLGSNTLSVQFDPADTVNFSSTTATVQLDVVEQSDLGDAPDSYSTLRSSDGPRHAAGGTLTLGATIDSDLDGQPTTDASGDNASDDGVSFITSVVASSTSDTVATIVVTVSESSLLDAWIDFDGDGTFDQANEHLGGGTSIPLSTGENRLRIDVPTGSLPGETFARFRVSTAGGLTPTGEAADGEVEDYAIRLLDASVSSTIDLSLPDGAITLFAESGDLVVERRGVDFFRAPADSVNRLEILGTEFSNVLTIDHVGGPVIPLGGLSYDGVDRVNTVRLVGAGHDLDLSRGGNTELLNIDVIDMSDLEDSVLTLDARAVRAMDPSGGGVIVVGSDGDSVVFADGESWRMQDPVAVAGISFNVIALEDTFVQTDFGSGWQNLAEPSDVNNDGNVTAGDALRIINELARRSFSDSDTTILDAPETVSPWPNVYFDQNGDGTATALDALRVINELARRSNSQDNGEGEASGTLPGMTEDLRMKSNWTDVALLDSLLPKPFAELPSFDLPDTELHESQIEFEETSIDTENVDELLGDNLLMDAILLSDSSRSP